MESRLIEYWRNRPEDLRRAVRDSREVFHRSSKAARGLPVGDYLVGESRSGAVVFGAVIADQCSTVEFSAVLKAAADFIEANRGGLQAARKAGKKTRQLVRLEVFLPPYFAPDMPPTIEGVPVEWFRWVPVNEHQVCVEKLAAASEGRVASDSVIVRLLGHLKWLAEVAKAVPQEKPPVGWAFRIYNAAVQLQFHTFFTPDAQAIAATNRGGKFSTALESLVTVGMKTTKSLRTPGGLAAARDTTIRNAEREELIEAADKVFRHALKSGMVGEITAERQRAFETAPDVAALLRALPGNGEDSEERHQSATATLQDEPELADLCRAIAGVVAARSPMVTGEVRPATQDAAQEMATGFLGVAVENLPKRHKVIGKAAGTLVKALKAVTSEDAGPA